MCRGIRRTSVCVEFGPGGQHAYSGGDDGIVRIWNADTGDALHTLNEHSRCRHVDRGQCRWKLVGLGKPRWHRQTLERDHGRASRQLL